MDTATVAKQLTTLCEKGQFHEAMEQLYGQNIVSVESHDMPNMPRETRGLDGVRKKAQWWNDNHTVHSVKVAGPFLANDKFSVVFDMDVTNKPSGKRMQMSEIAVYTVTDGKIIHEEFLYKQ